MLLLLSFSPFCTYEPTSQIHPSGGYKYLSTQPVIAIAPGVAIIILVLCCNMCGDALRDALDPKLRGTLGNGHKTRPGRKNKPARRSDKAESGVA